MISAAKRHQFCGRSFTEEEVALIREVVSICGGISRMELANTVCELLDWRRPGGRLKARECRDLLERLEAQGILKLPAKRSVGGIKPKRSIATVKEVQPHSPLTGSVEMFSPVDVELVESPKQRTLFQDLVSRYHYLGYAMPYGARLQYLGYASPPSGDREVLGCIQFSSPDWRMKVRDQWIGWDDARRKRALQHVVNLSKCSGCQCLLDSAAGCDWRGAGSTSTLADQTRQLATWHSRGD